jgi:protein-S-isoprenylcysteine O-methyltransferase Ste14
MPNPGLVIGVVWIAWLLSWLAAAGWANKTSAKPSLAREMPYRLITVVGALLMVAHHHMSWSPLWPDVVGIVLLIGGIAFAWWARLHLGRLWSSTVTAKQGHHVVDTGPYGLVRHPIYTGLLTSVLGTALAEQHWRCWIGAALIIGGTFIKARLEEAFLRQQLEAQAYDAYAARVPMLIPGMK